MDYEVVIIGGGVVGLSCAYFSSKKFSTMLVERHPSFGWETSSRNSEIIHSGIYYPTSSLKAKLCVRGNKSLYKWCEEHNIPNKRLGKFIVATEPTEIEYLQQLYQRAKDNGVDGIQWISQKSLRKQEPNVKAIEALWLPSTGILNSHILMESLQIEAKSNGCDFAYRHEVVAIEKTPEGYYIGLRTDDGDTFNVQSKFVINSAGLESDTIAQMLGMDVDSLGYRLCWAKGHYFRVKPAKSGLVNHLIYPVPPKDGNFLGIHLTLELDGGLKLGPDIVYLDERKQAYSVPEELLEKFFLSVSRYLDGLEAKDLIPDQAGIRPKLAYHSTNYPDFIINEESRNGFPGFVNLIGIESPGLTCCLEIGNLALRKIIDDTTP